MKKFLLMVLISLFFITSSLVAKVTIIEEGGKFVAVVTHSTTYKDFPQLNIIGSFQNWQKPGVPMVKNANGEWEYKIVMDAPMVKYKFYDPRISDDSAYIDDTENPDNKIANPFGSYDWIIKRPKKGSTGGAQEEDDFAPVFGMWARVYYSFQVISDLGQKIVYDKNGKVVYSGTMTGELEKDKATATVDNYKSEYAGTYDVGKYKVLASESAGESKKRYVEGQVGFYWAPWRFMGENGTEKGTYSRVILGRDSLTVSTTLKFHGKVSKYFKADVEINAQSQYYNKNESVFNDRKYVNTDTDNKVKNAREEWWANRIRNNASNFISVLYGGLGRDYVYPKQYFNNPNGTYAPGSLNGDAVTYSADEGVNTDAGSMYVDQVQFGWTTKDFDLNVAGAGGKSLYSKDPMSLISGERTGSTNYIQSNIIALVHPDKVKGLNINFGTTYSGAVKNYSGGGSTPRQDWGAFGNPVDSEIGRYLFYTDISYAILGDNKYKVGAIYTMNSYAPRRVRDEKYMITYTGIDAFANAIHEMALWTNLEPVSGLKINGELATELPTRVFNQLGYLDGNSIVVNEAGLSNVPLELTWKDLKVKQYGFDFIAQSAAYFDIGYSNKMIDVRLFTANAGRLFRGNMASYGSMFAGYTDVWAWNMTGVRGHGQAIGAINGGLDFSVNPITSDPELLKIVFNYDIVVSDFGSPDYLATSLDTILGQKVTDASTVIDPRKAFTLENRWTPGVESSFKAGNHNIKLSAGVCLALETSFGQALIDGKAKDVNSSVFTFRGAKVGFAIDNLSEVLKSLGVNYALDIRNYSASEFGAPGAEEFVVMDTIGNEVTGSKTALTQEIFNRYNNKWNLKYIYNTISADLRFKNDISLSAGYIFRYTHGLINANDDEVTYNDGGKVLTNAQNYVKTGNSDEDALYYAVADYWTWGLAFQFKYVIPVKILKTPTLFCNLNFGWDPSQYYDPGFLTTADWDVSRSIAGTAADWTKGIHSFQFSQVTIGLQWDF